MLFQHLIAASRSLWCLPDIIIIMSFWNDITNLAEGVLFGQFHYVSGLINWKSEAQKSA